MSAEASWRDCIPWYSHPAYVRYWQHYYQAMAWMHNHHHAFRKARDLHFNSKWYILPLDPCSYYADHGGYPQPFCIQYSHPQDYHYTYQHFGMSGEPPSDNDWAQASSREEQTSSSEEEMESESDECIICDVSNMEITEELRQYFAQTERHREEHRRQQQLDAERLCEYVNADHDLYCGSNRSVEPPSERPGERRLAEMKRLYGESAAKIQAMETAMQLSFNKHCDRKHPKYWPVIPLKF
ncbi:gem-associated protein 8 [Rhynchocyon petersi]